MKLLKTFSALILCLSILFVSVSAVDTSLRKPEGVSDTLRRIDGVFEFIDNWVIKFSLRQNYKACNRLCSIPLLEDEYIPQGFCYIDNLDYYAISAYKADDNSVISIVDAKTGARIKTVKLCYEDGSACTAHVGGLADIGEYLFVSSGKSMRRVKITDITGAEDFSEIRFCGKINADMQASNACSYGNYLLIGKFYSFTSDGTYDSVPSQWVKMPGGGRCYSLCEVFDMTDMEKVIADEKAVPVAVITLPLSTQGIAWDGKCFCTSSSSSRIGYSTLRKYKLTGFDTEYCIDIAGNEVPLVFLDKENLSGSVKLPPMIEGIDYCKGKPCGIFESGSEKFTVVTLRTPYICSFEE